MQKSIVIVDDEPIIRMSFAEVFRDAGYLVAAEAADGYDAVALCREHHPDIILIDMKMPMIDGISASETISREELCPCIVLLTAFANNELAERAKRAGITAYLAKPISDFALLSAVEVAYQTSQQLAEAQAALQKSKLELESQRLIEQAKGFLAKRDQISETEAYQKLRSWSMEKRCPVSAIAKQIVSANSPRKPLDIVKDKLMKQQGISEQACYAYLKKQANRAGVTVESFAADLLRDETKS